MYRSGLVNMLVTHTNMKGLGLTPLFSGDRHSSMLPQLKKKLGGLKPTQHRTPLTTSLHIETDKQTYTVIFYPKLVRQHYFARAQFFHRSPRSHQNAVH